MSAMLSDQWYRVARNKPRLRANVRVRRHLYRGERWYLLTEEGSDRTFRIDSASYAFIGRCDGVLPADLVWETVATELGEQAPTQDALLRLMVRLQAAGFLHFERQADISSLFPTRRERLSRRGRRLNPFAFRVGLGNPGCILRALAPLDRLLFRPVMFWLWACAVLAGAVLALFELDGLVAHAGTLLSRPETLWMIWLLYLPVKLVHELAHGLAVRRWGGEVREWGLAMLLLLPIPYVDASAASSYPRKRRAVVSAAGIMAELAIATTALAVWLLVQPGLVRDIAMLLMTICAVSTLLANGNPLLRFDGYFVLTDLLELPNLATRSAQWWRGQFRRRVQGLRGSEDEIVPAAGERPWLMAYQPLSWLYRLALIAAVVLWLGGLMAWLALIAALWFGWLLLLRPLARGFGALLDPQLPDEVRLRSRALATGFALALAATLFLVPVSDVTVAEGVAWLPDDARIRNESAGFVVEVVRGDGAAVSPGDLILRLADDELHAEHASLTTERRGLEAALFQHLRDEPARAAQTAQRIAQVERQLAHLDARIAALEVRATRAGTLVLPDAADLPGRHLARGEALGAVLDGAPGRVRVVLPHAAVGRLADVRGISVRLSEAPQLALNARLDGRLPGARMQLPAAALGRPAGGSHAIDPSDPEGLKTLAALVWVDLELPGHPQRYGGGRAWARFEHSNRPLAAQLWVALRQLVLGSFEPEAMQWQ